ncbi:MAG: hypothetical protein HY599_05355, partial [Candidatus Omnitrophica bacterium]|nr:hypothetical protein [Candidatus Omnitrophota bacterium]
VWGRAADAASASGTPTQPVRHPLANLLILAVLALLLIEWQRYTTKPR